MVRWLLQETSGAVDMQVEPEGLENWNRPGFRTILKVSDILKVARR